MKHRDGTIGDRRSVITGLGLAAAGIAVASTGTAQAQQGRAFRPARHELDAWMGELPGSHRVFVDSASMAGGGDALLYANNVYMQQVSAYGGADSDLAMIVCFRHFSTPFGYTDAMWKKYGADFHKLMQATGDAPEANPMNGAGDPVGGVTLGSLAAKGTQFAICSAATRFIANQLASNTNMQADDVFNELLANAVPGGRFVPAGVMALTRSQEYGYSVLIAG